jgi:hypothetical protein
MSSERKASGVEIDDTQRFLELRQAHPADAFGIEGERSAVEDQFILAADQVA